MLINSKELQGYKLKGTDGDLGKVREFYFDDKHWTIRYLVADTGGWLANRAVLISPYALEAIETESSEIAVALTKKQIESSPPLSSDQPVSQQFEDSYYGYYGWPRYWYGSYSWGRSPFIVNGSEDLYLDRKMNWDSHLRSTQAVSGYHIHAVDGKIGHVKDFIIDDQTWAIRYLVVEAGNWFTGKNVLISPQWIKSVNWNESAIYASLSKEEIKTSPEYSGETLLERAYEKNLYYHYGQQSYWDSEAAIPPQGLYLQQGSGKNVKRAAI
jgi:uncharacterized protein YrrD